MHQQKRKLPTNARNYLTLRVLQKGCPKLIRQVDQHVQNSRKQANASNLISFHQAANGPSKKLFHNNRNHSTFNTLPYNKSTFATTTNFSQSTTAGGEMSTTHSPHYNKQLVIPEKTKFISR